MILNRTLCSTTSGNPQYGIVTESYPFVARKLLKEDRPAIQKALQQLLYSPSGIRNINTLKVLFDKFISMLISLLCTYGRF